MLRYSPNGTQRQRRSPFGFFRIFLEIPIIAFSIYLAFLLSERNQAKTEAISEKKYLQELLEEVKINRERLSVDLDKKRSQVVLLEKMLETSMRRVDADTLRLAMKELLNVHLYTPTDAVYQDLVSSGNLSLITSDTLMQYHRKLSRIPFAGQSDPEVKQIQSYLIGKKVFSLLEPYADVKGIAISQIQKNRIIRVLLNDRTFIDLVYLRHHSLNRVIRFETPMQQHLRKMQLLIEAQLSRTKK